MQPLLSAGGLRCFQNAARHLAPGGHFVIELWMPQLRSLPPRHDGTVEVNQPGYPRVDTYDVLNQLVISHHVRFGPEIFAPCYRLPLSRTLGLGGDCHGGSAG